MPLLPNGIDPSTGAAVNASCGAVRDAPVSRCRELPYASSIPTTASLTAKDLSGQLLRRRLARVGVEARERSGRHRWVVERSTT